MGLRSRLAKFIAPAQSAPEAPQNSAPMPIVTRTAASWSEFIGDIGKLPAPTEQTALTVSAIHACINLISGAIAAMPVNIYRVDVTTGERDQTFDDPLHWVFNEQMSPRWSAASGWEFLCQGLLLHGDGIAIIQRTGLDARPAGLMPVHPRRVTVLPNQDATRLVYAIAPEFVGGPPTIYDQDDILHVPGFGFDGLRGMSPLRYSLRMAAPATLAMQEFAANFFANSGRPDYALRTDQALGPEAVEQLRSQVEERHAGAANAHRPMLLHSGLDIKPITMPLEEMQLVDARQFQIEEIARIYGVPPFMIGHNEKTTSWGSGVEAMGIGFVRYTLRQHLVKFENELNRKIFRTAARAVEFDTTDLERADTASLFTALRTALGRAGEQSIMSVNEARRILRLKRDPDADSNKLAKANPAKQVPEPGKPSNAAA